MKKVDIIKKKMTELVENGFSKLPFYMIVFVDKRPTLRQMALSIKTAELIDGLELKLDYKAIDYLSERNKLSTRQALYKNLLLKIRNPNDCFRFYCINDETLLAAKKNVLFEKVFIMAEDIFKARINYLTKLLHSEGSDYKEIINNAFNSKEEALRAFIQETIKGRELFDYIKVHRLMPEQLINGSLIIIKGVEEGINRIINEAYQ